MAVQIDNLEIDINVNTSGLKALDTLGNSLKAFQDNIKGIGGKRIEQFAASIQGLVNSISKITGLEKIEALGASLKTVADPLRDLGAASAIIKVGENEKKQREETKKTREETKKTTKANHQFLSSLVRIAKYRLIRSAIKAIGDSIRSAMGNLYTFDKFMGGSGAFSSTLDQLASSLIYLQNSFMVAFSPLIEVVVPILTQVMDKIAQFNNAVGNMFAVIQGKNVYTAASKSALTYMQIAKQAQNVTLGFDELNTTGNQMNISSMFEEVETDRNALGDMLGIVETLRTEIGKIYISLKKVVDPVLELTKTILPAILSLVAAIMVLLEPLIAFVADTIDNMAPVLGEFLETALNIVGQLLGIIGRIFVAISPILDAVMQIATTIISAISPVLDSIASVIANIIDLLMPMLKPVINFAAELLEKISPILEVVIEIVGAAIDGINQILPIFKPLAELLGYLFDLMEPIISAITGFMLSGLDVFLKIVVACMETINEVFGTFARAFNKLMTGDFAGFVNEFKALGEKIKSIWGGVGKAIANVFINAINAIIGGFESMINGIVKGINKIVDAINSVSNFFGGKSVSYVGNVSFNKLPTYATGGFPEDGLFFANSNELVGQFSNGQTAVANNDQIVDGISAGVYEAVVSAMGDSNGQGELKLNVYLDGRQIKASYDRLTRQQGYVIDAGGML